MRDGQWHDLELVADFDANAYVELRLVGPDGVSTIDLSGFPIAAEPRGWGEEAMWIALEGENRWSNCAEVTEYEVFYDSLVVGPVD